MIDERRCVRIEYSEPTEEDRKMFVETGFSQSCLDGRTKITCHDAEGNEASVFVFTNRIEELGKKYISDHAVLRYEKFCDSWRVIISENDYYNDQKRNPDKTIDVKFEGSEGSTEIYIGTETKRYYLRQNYPEEGFAKWYICGKRRTVDDGDEPRANLIFRCNGKIEKVRYDDWNGVAAYSDTYNHEFKPKDETVERK